MPRSHEVRIIGGALRGRAIRTLPGLTTRPTRALVREALFDILGETLDDAHVLDLFAGSGALGIEALSRGAAHATFVEIHRRMREVLERELARLLPPDRWQCLGMDALTLKACALGAAPIDTVFLDPPYSMWSQGAWVRELFENLRRLLHAQALAPGVKLVLEGESAAVLKHAERTFTLADQREYGRTCLFFLQAREQSA